MKTRLYRGGAAAHAAVAPPLARVLATARRSARLGLQCGIPATLALVAASAGCNLLDDDQDLPDIARVDITGTAPVDLELVVSDNFQRVNDLEQGARYNVLVHADTSFVRPDFSRDYDIRATQRFLVRLTNHSSEVASITLSVAFDGEVSFSQRANIAESGSLEFSEIFFGT